MTASPALDSPRSDTVSPSAPPHLPIAPDPVAVLLGTSLNTLIPGFGPRNPATELVRAYVHYLADLTDFTASVMRTMAPRD